MATALIIVASVWVASVRAVQLDRTARIEAGLDRITGLTELFAADTAKSLRYADTMLKSARRIYMRTRATQGIDALLADVPLDEGLVSHLTLIDRHGTPVYLSNREPRPGSSAADRPYFQAQLSTPGDRAYLSQSLRGRNTGLITMLLVRRLEEPDGRFSGVVFAAIKVERLAAFIQSAPIEDEGTLYLVGLDRKVRATSSGAPTALGEEFAEAAMWQSLPDAPMGLFQSTRADGGITYFAYRRLANYPLVAIIGGDRADLLAGGRDFARFAYAVAALVSLIMLLLTTVVLRNAARVRHLQSVNGLRSRAAADARRNHADGAAALANLGAGFRHRIGAIRKRFGALSRAELPPDAARQAVEGEAEAERLLQQFGDLLDATQLKAGTLPISLRRESLRPVIATLKEDLDDRIARSGKPISATVEIGPDTPDGVPMDRERVAQVVRGLIDMAIQATVGANIDLLVRRESKAGRGVLTISVSDTGLGHSQGDAVWALEEASTRYGSRSAEDRLPLLRDLAIAMAGHLDVRSHPGAGSTFSLSLPLEHE